MTKKIIFSAGGTGGHIFPAINLMKHFFERGDKVLLVTDIRGNNFIKKYSEFKSYVLRMGTPTNKNFFKKFISFLVIFYSIIKSIIILKKERPDLIIGFGGYVSFPISFASKFFDLPLIIYENNMVLGRANQYLSSISKKILLAKKMKKNFLNKFLFVGVSALIVYDLNSELFLIKLFPLLSVTNKTLYSLSKKCFIKLIAGNI